MGAFAARLLALGRRWGAAVAAPLLVGALALGVASYWRGPQPDLEPPPARYAQVAAELLGEVRRFLTDESTGDARAPAEGRWYVTAYGLDGTETVTVRAEGAFRHWAEPLRRVWPARLQVDRALDEPLAARAGPFGFGLDVGLDGWLGQDGRVDVPVSFLLGGFDRPRLADYQQAHAGAPLRTWSWVAGAEGPLWLLRGTIDPGTLDPALLRRRLDLGADYLARHLRSDYRYDYEYDARTDEVRPGYNLLRHAGTTYSLFQIYRRTGREAHYRAGARALRYLEAARRIDSADPTRCFELEEDKVKLGGAALTLLALVEQARARPADAEWAWMRCLAGHIVSQLGPAGDFASFYTDGGRYGASSHRSGYYPGEAVLALVALHGIDPESRWLTAACQAADYLVHRRWFSLGIRVRVPLDAWLAQALARLVDHAPRAGYAEYAFAIGRAIVRSQLDGPHIAADLRGGPAGRGWPDVVAAGSRGEALAAVARLERRYRPGEHRFWDSLQSYARFALRSQYTEPTLMGLRSPERARGGFRTSSVDPLIRIDGVQHNLSALAGLLDLLEEAR